MPAFFIDPSNVQGEVITVSGALLHHLRASLRSQPGDTLYLTVPGVRRYRTTVTSVDRTRLTSHIAESTDAVTPPSPQLVLAQAILKHDRMDWVIQKATELGVESIQPLVTDQSVVRPDPKRAEAQRERWQRISIEASQQSERWLPSVVAGPLSLEQWMIQWDSPGLALVLLERTHAVSLQTVGLDTRQQTITLLVGPEGGWREKEIDGLVKKGAVPVGMGENILRSETASLAAISIIQGRLGRLGTAIQSK
ncbi:ribosomal RNA small subunit methyltransferase E [Nitrospira sp.]|nr:ribosomal RNA small subunit methyltransferase E [Nitrospira sp.]